MAEIAPYLSALVSAVLAYIAMRTGAERRFAALEARQAAQDERVARAIEEAKIGRELTVQIASLATKVDDLRGDVSKHNDLIERTFKLESDLQTAFHRIDELRDDVHDARIGGTK